MLDDRNTIPVGSDSRQRFDYRPDHYGGARRAGASLFVLYDIIRMRVRMVSFFLKSFR